MNIQKKVYYQLFPKEAFSSRLMTFITLIALPVFSFLSGAVNQSSVILYSVIPISYGFYQWRLYYLFKSKKLRLELGESEIVFWGGFFRSDKKKSIDYLTINKIEEVSSLPPLGAWSLGTFNYFEWAIKDIVLELETTTSAVNLRVPKIFYGEGQYKDIKSKLYDVALKYDWEVIKMSQEKS